MPFLLDFTMLMVLQKNVVQVIFAKVKPPIKPLAHPDPTPPTKDPLRALNAHPARMPTLLVPHLAKVVTVIPTNRNSMLQNAFQCKKGSTNRVQQPKLNARWVKQEAVAMLRVTIVKLGGSKNYQATLRAVNAQLVLVTKLKVLRRAMLSLLDRTVGTVKYVNVKQVIIAPVKLQTKRLVVLGRMQPVQNQFRVLNAHQARMRLFLVPKLAKIVTVIPTNLNPMLRNAFECKKVSTNPVQQPK